MTHICVSEQTIIWATVGILLIKPLGTNFSEILIAIYIFPFCAFPIISAGNWYTNSGRRCSKTLRAPNVRVGNTCIRSWFLVSISYKLLLYWNIDRKWFGSVSFENLYQTFIHWTSNISVIFNKRRCLNNGSVCALYSVLSIYRCHFSFNNSRKTPHISPLRSRYGTSFLSAKFDLSFGTITVGLCALSCCIQPRYIESLQYSLFVMMRTALFCNLASLPHLNPKMLPQIEYEKQWTNRTWFSTHIT